MLFSEEFLGLLGRETSPRGLAGDRDEVGQLQTPPSDCPIISAGDEPSAVIGEPDMSNGRFVPTQDDGRGGWGQHVPEADRSIFTG